MTHMLMCVIDTVGSRTGRGRVGLGARNRVEIAMWACETRRIIPGT